MRVEDLDTPPPPPIIRREISATCTDQGDEPTCSYHSLAKIMVQNVCGVLIDLTMTSKEKKMYNDCLTAYPLRTDVPIHPYTIKHCSEKGVLKIMLFCYFYE